MDAGWDGARSGKEVGGEDGGARTSVGERMGGMGEARLVCGGRGRSAGRGPLQL